MGRVDDYKAALAACGDWDAYLLEGSGLPGPRGNLELMQAAVDMGNESLFLRYAAIAAEPGQVQSASEFLAMVGVVGLGRLVAEGRDEFLPQLRRHASDARWRVREATAMALQRVGDAHPSLLRATAQEWARGGRLEQRAAVAGIAEPRLLQDGETAATALQVMDEVTCSLVGAADRKSELFRVLRQALGYAWSVAVVAAPNAGKALMEKWLAVDDAEVRWVMRENLKKARLERMDAAWVEKAVAKA
jgi:hypothetical protein